MNPVRIRNGTATVYAEAAHLTKVGHWGIVPEKAVGELVRRESGDLLRRGKKVLPVPGKWMGSPIGWQKYGCDDL